MSRGAQLVESGYVVVGDVLVATGRREFKVTGIKRLFAAYRFTLTAKDGTEHTIRRDADEYVDVRRAS